MKPVFTRTAGLTDKPFHYCPGCTHGIIHRLIAEAIVDLGALDTTIGVSPVGCTYNNYEYFACDMVQAAHGRAPAVATAIKRVHPDSLIFTYQGDGDLAAIGAAEIIHAAARGEKISTFFVNNAIYGMTGGQMAPTTLLGQHTTTTPGGRGKHQEGGPIRVCELLSSLDGVSYLERTSVSSPRDVIVAKRAIKKAFENQMDGKGYSLVEVLSMCPTDWKLTPQDAVKFVNDEMKKTFPLGVFKDR